MGRLLRSLSATIERFFYPPVCLGCRDAVGSAASLCARCWSGLSFIERPYCEVLGLPFAYDRGAGSLSPLAIAEPPPYARLRSAVVHRDLGARLVSALKYSDRTDLAAPMAAWMARAGAELLIDADVVVPVPLHPGRLFRRRFNQSAELGRHLSSLSGVPCRALALARVKATRSQVGLGPAARRENVSGAFKVRPRRLAEIEGRRVLLIDDVYTTGSTVMAATKALKRAGAGDVDVLTFARVADEPI